MRRPALNLQTRTIMGVSRGAVAEQAAELVRKGWSWDEKVEQIAFVDYVVYATSVVGLWAGVVGDQVLVTTYPV